MGRITDRRPIVSVDGAGSGTGVRSSKTDNVVVEAPLTITIDGQVVATTMRTPGHDLELAAGWLVTEARLRESGEIVSMTALAASSRSVDGSPSDGSPSNGNEIDTVRVTLADGVVPPQPRAYVTSSACGVCSVEVLEQSQPPSAPVHSPSWRLTATSALQAIDDMRAQQRSFDLSGAVHAAAIANPDLEIVVVREDVGRHNAVDKVVGRCLLDDALPLTDHVLVVSGRVSYEIVAKAISACIGTIVAVSGPTSLAVDLARAHDLVLIGFARDERMNVYSGETRVTS